MYSTIITSIENNIFTISINRPDKLNALNKEVIEELSKAIDEIYQDENIKAAIITGSGPKAFVAGADISEFLTLDAAAGKNLSKKGHEEVFNKIENCPKPIIAAVNGFALGGGCELAMACHFRLCSDNAKFGQPEVSLGLIPGYGGTQRLTHLIGKGKAMELMMTGNMITANEASYLGLVNHVTTAEELLPAATKILQTIISKAPLAIAEVIRLVNAAAYDASHGLENEIDAFGKLFSSDDVKEGATAFLEKRKAVFKGK